MPPLVFPLPTTSLLSFSNILHGPSSSYTTSVADATSARTKLHLALKGVAEHDPNSRALAVVDVRHRSGLLADGQAAQGYMPYLRGIIACLDADELLFKGEPVFPWRSPLTSYSATQPLLLLPSIYSEYLFVILAYVLALANHAHAILAALPNFEASPVTKTHMSSEDEKKTTAGLTRAVDLLCQASGIAEWAAEKMVPLVDPVRVASGGRAGKNKWPVEAGTEAFRGLAMTLLADAHVTAIRKLLIPVSSHALFAPPGPPLPKHHPSPALLAKLYLHVAGLYTSARALFEVHASEPSSRKLFKVDRDEPDHLEGEIIPAFKRYLRKESLLASALAHKWLGVDAGENGNGATVGGAIAWMTEARAKLEDLDDGAVKDKMKSLGIGKANGRKKEERKARKGRVERELEDVGAWLKAYSRMNDTVLFQSVPLISSFNAPSGRPIFAAKPFKPPPSKFGPVSHDCQHQESAEDDYAGKGTYF